MGPKSGRAPSPFPLDPDRPTDDQRRPKSKTHLNRIHRPIPFQPVILKAGKEVIQGKNSERGL